MRPRHGLPLLLLATLAASCAGPTQLARQSERALQAGDLQKAYDLARRGVDADPDHLAARRAMTEAAAQRVDVWKARIVEAATIDTLAAADRALELRDFRGELSRYAIQVPDDPGFLERERRILDGAASIEYRRGEVSLEAKRPKDAYRHYQAAASFVASYGDVQDKLRSSHQRGMTRVAILPFTNDIGVPGISRAVADAAYREIGARLASEGFEFTELVSPDEIYASMTVRELDRLPTESVLRIARGVEAGRVVVGRLYGMRASTNSWNFDFPIYHKVAERDTSGRSHDRWISTRFQAIARERVVTLRWDLEVLDAHSGASLTTLSEPVETAARVAWTDFRADGDCDDYRLTPPDRDDSDDGKAVRARWQECFGGWRLSDMLARARGDRRRAVYDSRYRDEFRGDSRRRPVLCGELPGEDDMATLGLADAWRPLLATLKGLDRTD